MRINLKKSFFSEKEFVIVENKDMRAIAFRYSTGVEAIRVENKKGSFTILPFQGQQIWRAEFMGRNIGMKTLFEEPVPTKDLLKTYGCFLMHCGISGMGVPQEGDSHAQHGEIPNGDYATAYIDCGEDYIAVGGSYIYNESFKRNYTFSPECRLYADDTVLKFNIELENRRNEPMEYMYLAHINFRPINGAELIYSGDYGSVKPYRNVENPQTEDEKKLYDYLNRLDENPEIHHKVGAEGQCYKPEICFNVKYKGDENNRAYTLQYTENDGACYTNHPVDVLPEAIRWIARTSDEDSMGMVLPATAEHLGYSHAKRNGQIKVLGPNEKLNFTLEAGYLNAEQAKEVKSKIEKINIG